MISWNDTTRIETGADYIESLRGRDVSVYLFGDLVENPVDHPLIRPSINAVAATYDLANEFPDIGSVESSLSGEQVNRFLHVTESVEDVVSQSRMQRLLGQKTGTCFQRCVGMDAINSLFTVTAAIDEEHGTGYHDRFRSFLIELQRRNLVLAGAMTDVKGDRSKPPGEQADRDLHVHVSERRDDGIVIRGAKAHQTGAVNSHWIVVMPTLRLRAEDADFAVVAAIPVDADGLTFIYGRQSCDLRALEQGADVDLGNAGFAGQEALVMLDDVFVPWEHVFMDGEHDHAADLVESFTNYHRRSYVCKAGVGDVLIGAAALAADYNGVEAASHISDKLVEMIHLNETIYGIGMAASHESRRTSAGNYEPDALLANVCKQNVTRFPYELARLAQDLAGGLMVTMPSERDWENPDLAPMLDKYLQGRDGVSTEDRRRVLRLIENLTLGRNAVGYLTESMHGAGSPQAQRIQIRRSSDIEGKKSIARRIAGIPESDQT